MNEGSTLSRFPGFHAFGIITIVAALMVVVFVADLVIPRGIGIGFFYVIPLFLCLWSTRKETYFVAGMISLLIVMGFVLSPPGTELWASLSNRGISLLAVWSVAMLVVVRRKSELEKERAISEREKAFDEVKTLRGFLPICASCKKIRDDKGYWTQIEAYIANHSEAQFSHGICPECAKKLYPEFYREDSGPKQ